LVIIKLTRGRVVLSYNPFRDIGATIAAGVVGMLTGGISLAIYIAMRILSHQNPTKTLLSFTTVSLLLFSLSVVILRYLESKFSHHF